MQRPPLWWQSGATYQIYPRSFADASGDGVGDLPGIIGRLEHLAWLGVDAIWLSPFYRSPMADFGYDVADYTDVDPLFGTLADFDRLIAETQRRGIRVIVDYVPNHTSDQHRWFLDSRSSLISPKRDWYTWRDPGPDGGPPNNWVSMFGGSAWERDPTTGQYYLHSFLKEQPDLDWRNPEVHAAMLDVLRFWLDRGVAGFRIDVANFVAKDPLLRDNPPHPAPGEVAHLSEWNRQVHLYDHAHPDFHEIYRDVRSLVDSYPGDRVTIGELHHPDLDVWAGFYGENLDEIHLPFNFHLLHASWDASSVRNVVNGVVAALPRSAWASWVLGNHDQARVASRVGIAQAPVAMMLLLTLPGAPTIYYGDEIGMENGIISPEAVRDTWGITEPGYSRDPERTPMHWDGSPNAGFCRAGVAPWLPLAPGWEQRNVAAQRADDGSLLNLTRRLLALRRENPALAHGDYLPLDGTPPDVFAYLRRADGAPDVLITLNFADAKRTMRCENASRVLAATDHQRRAGERLGETFVLGPNEGLVIELTGARWPGSEAQPLK
ncbi:MAG TPA: alpha-amylase family glycosyl hydrolase [Candidatus Limnocylindrales bacterium]|nr:alpha-amylase family glycosyl hydrolase [Candidatus Limnocylindrales bacterium]